MRIGRSVVSWPAMLVTAAMGQSETQQAAEPASEGPPRSIAEWLAPDKADDRDRILDWRTPVDPKAGTVSSTERLTQSPRPGQSEEGEWFVAPVPFLNPQVDAGLAVGVGYLFRFEGQDETVPPSLIAAGGFYSSNDSFAALVGGDFYLGQDDWRIKTGGGIARINYDFFGIGSGAGDDGTSVPFRSEFVGLGIDAVGKLSKDVYLGPVVNYGQVDTDIRGNIDDLPLEDIQNALDTTYSELGVHFEWDTRDDTIYPTTGRVLDAKLLLQDSAWGATFDYQKLNLEYKSFHALDEDSVLGWRVVTNVRAGDAPFYDLASHNLRGYEPGRYRDELWLAGEIEYRRHLWGPLSGVLFASAGQVAPTLGELTLDNILPAIGAGLRIRLTERNPMNYRIDVAVGRNEAYLYIAVGEAF